MKFWTNKKSFVLAAILILSGCSDDGSFGPPTNHSESLSLSYVGGELWSGVTDLSVDGDLLACAVYNGVEIVDIGTLAEPAQLAQVFLPGKVHTVVVEGNYVYALGNDQFTIIEVSSTGSAHVVSTLDVGGSDLVIHDGHAYFLNLGLKVVDISNPLNPRLVAEHGTYYSTMSQVGEWLYLVGGASLKILSVADPENPVSVGSYNLGFGTGAEKIAVTGTTCCVWSSYSAPSYPGSSWGRITLIDASDPEHPSMLKVLEFGFILNVDLVAKEGVLLLSNYRGVYVIDITDPENAFRTGGYSSLNASGISLAIQDEHVFFAGVEIISVANPASPAMVGEYLMEAGIGEVKLSGEYAYVVDRRGLQIVDVADPTNPEPRGRITRPSRFKRDVDVQEGYAYLIDGYQLVIIDIADPDTPQVLGAAVFTYHPYRVEVNGQYAYVTTARRGFHVVDIENPTAPELVGTLGFTSDIRDVAVEGTLAYLTVLYQGLKVVDVSNPTDPVLVGSVRTNSDVWDVAVSGPLAFVAGGYDGVRILDISDPTSPVLLSSCRTSPSVQGLSVQGSLLVIASFPPMQVINFSNPQSPYVDGHYGLGAAGVAISGDLVYTAGSSFSVFRIDGLNF